MNPVKLIVTSKTNLKFKYGKKFSEIEKLLKNLQDADKKRGLDTKIVFIDDATSAKRARLKPAKAITEQKEKRAVDDLYREYVLLILLFLVHRISSHSRKLIILQKMKIPGCL